MRCALSIAPRPWLLRLKASVPVARDGRDPEGVHQLRVAARRLGVFLDLAGMRVLGDDLRWLRRRAAPVRDLDVLLARELPAPFRAWLVRQRAAERRGLLLALSHPRLDGLLAALRLVAPVPAAQARRRLAVLAAPVLEAAGAMERAPSRLPVFHALRRALRRLRYALEWLGEPAAPLAELQAALGAIGDAAVALRLVEAYPARRRCAALHGALATELSRGKRGALVAWARARSHVGRLG